MTVTVSSCHYADSSVHYPYSFIKEETESVGSPYVAYTTMLIIDFDIPYWVGTTILFEHCLRCSSRD